MLWFHPQIRVESGLINASGPIVYPEIDFDRDWDRLHHPSSRRSLSTHRWQRSHKLDRLGSIEPRCLAPTRWHQGWSSSLMRCCSSERHFSGDPLNPTSSCCRRYTRCWSSWEIGSTCRLCCHMGTPDYHGLYFTLPSRQTLVKISSTHDTFRSESFLVTTNSIFKVLNVVGYV